MTPFAEKIKRLRQYVGHMKSAKLAAKGRPVTCTVTPELIEFMEGVIDLAESERLTTDELWLIYSALVKSGMPIELELATKINSFRDQRVQKVML